MYPSTSPLAYMAGIVGTPSAKNPTVRLVKQYKGLELSQEVRFVDVTPDRAALETSRLDFCTILEGEIHLHSQIFPRPLTAQLIDLDYGSGMFELSDFAYMEWKDRQSERVQPKDPTYVTVQCRRSECRAFLEDISTRGIGLLTKQDTAHEMKARPGNGVALDFQLTAECKYNRLRGVVRYARKIGNELIKVGIEIYPNTKQFRALGTYVAQRKTEILDEVNQAFATWRSPRGVENLYF